MEQVLDKVREVEKGRMLEADETGMLTIPAELLGYPEPNTRFVVERVGKRILIQPETAQEIEQKSAYDKWHDQWKIVQQEVTKSWPVGLSAADVVSEMRR